MFSNEIIDSDAFLTMPVSTQNLYFHLGMRADDDGFSNKTKTIMAMCNASEGDLLMLLDKHYIIPFNTGVIVIKHWRINNYLRADRYHPTKYQDEFNQLVIKKNGTYTLDNNCGIPDVNQSVTERREEESRVEKSRVVKKVATASPRQSFSKPSIQDIQAYCTERGNGINAERFYDTYESKGWKVGTAPMKDWKAAVRNWERRDAENNPQADTKVTEAQKRMSIKEAKQHAKAERLAELRKQPDFKELERAYREMALEISKGSGNADEYDRLKQQYDEVVGG